jgi:hypothetical protein
MRAPIVSAMLCLLLASGCARLSELFAPRRPAPTPATSRPAHPERREPPARLSPQVGTEAEERLAGEAQRTIQGAEQRLRSIDVKRLAPHQAETYQTVHSFLGLARAALSRKDFPQALNLAQKAQILSDELSRALR